MELLKWFLRNEDGFLAFLGGLFKAAATAFIGGQVKRHFAKKNYQDQRALGFTHSEIAGSGAYGAGGAAEGNIMGNQATALEAQRKQQEYDTKQRELDREVAIRAQDMGLAQSQMQSQATLGAAKMAMDAQFNNAMTQFDIAAMNNDRQWQQMANNWANNNPQLNMRMKQLSMGVDNMVVELIMQRNGLDVSGQQEYSQAEFNRRMTSVMSELAATQGWHDVLREGVRQGTAATNDILNKIESGKHAPPGNPVNTPPMPQIPFPVMGNPNAVTSSP